VISTTLIAGQAFAINLATMSLKEVIAGDYFLGGKIYAGDCKSAASPAACGASAAGSAVIAAAAATVVVNSTAVAANSVIVLVEDESLGTKLGVTCNTQTGLVLGTLKVTARNAGTSFTAGVDVVTTANPLCFNFWIVN